ncbi:MAG: YXWGXW repeat-containing protein [Gammaproteobacteria bacterium]
MKRIITALLMAAALGGSMLAVPIMASAQLSIGVSVGYAPPPLPWYPQPFCPGAGYLWTPGYWSYGPYGYYWVPGTWVLAPAVGLFWTPGYWAWNGGYYWWHAGYWGPTVGYYGGINYGYGYAGIGYFGGYWRRGAFYYNRAVSNVNITYIHNTYNQTVINNYPAASRVSYNGGDDGTRMRPTTEQLAFARAPHVMPTVVQMQQRRLAMNNPAQRFAVNQGRPEIAATAKPGKFSGSDVVRMNPEQNAYVYRPAARNLVQDRPSFQNADRVERTPQIKYVNSYANESQQAERSNRSNYANGNRVAQPRPMPPVSQNGNRDERPPEMDNRNPYANQFRPVEVPNQGNRGNGNRVEEPRPMPAERPQVRQPAMSVPRPQERAPSRDPRQPHNGEKRPPR